MSFFKLSNVCKGYGANGSRSEVLRNINLDVHEGEFVAIDHARLQDILRRHDRLLTDKAPAR